MNHLKGAGQHSVGGVGANDQQEPLARPLGGIRSGRRRGKNGNAHSQSHLKGDNQPLHFRMHHKPQHGLVVLQKGRRVVPARRRRIRRVDAHPVEGLLVGHVELVELVVGAGRSSFITSPEHPRLAAVLY